MSSHCSSAIIGPFVALALAFCLTACEATPGSDISDAAVTLDTGIGSDTPPQDFCPENPEKTSPGQCGCAVPDTDSDGDGTPNCLDGCPGAPEKTHPGLCGCAADDSDLDGDGALDCVDACPEDALKMAPGLCGCGQADGDMDGDDAPDCVDACPGDSAKSLPGLCGCGAPDADSDDDGSPDCWDGCPDDAGKILPGACGCGESDLDTDADGQSDCHDACPEDGQKSSPGVCGCGAPDADSDGDGVFDCVDLCPGDPGKSAPGICGCGVPEDNADGAGSPDCADPCPDDPAKETPGVCGCGLSDTDDDGDGVPNCADACPEDSEKALPGPCGCGTPDIDTDGDGAPDCIDACPQDAEKAQPGTCGCSAPDSDSDGDGAPDCIDACPQDAEKAQPGTCGCGAADTDSDQDGSADCVDACPADAGKTLPGQCGCGATDADGDQDGVPDCLDLCPTNPVKAAPGTCGCAFGEAKVSGVTECSLSAGPQCVPNGEALAGLFSGAVLPSPLRVVLAEGTYCLSEPLSLPSDTEIVGAGHFMSSAFSRLHMISDGMPAIRVDGAFNVRIESLDLVPDNSVTGANGVEILNGSSQVKVLGTSIRHGRIGILVESSQGTEPNALLVLADNLISAQADTGIKIHQLVDSIIERNHIDDVGYDGIKFTFGPINNNVVRANYTSGAVRDGIDFAFQTDWCVSCGNDGLCHPDGPECASPCTGVCLDLPTCEDGGPMIGFKDNAIVGNISTGNTLQGIEMKVSSNICQESENFVIGTTTVRHNIAVRNGEMGLVFTKAHGMTGWYPIFDAAPLEDYGLIEGNVTCGNANGQLGFLKSYNFEVRNNWIRGGTDGTIDEGPCGQAQGSCEAVADLFGSNAPGLWMSGGPNYFIHLVDNRWELGDCSVPVDNPQCPNAKAEQAGFNQAMSAGPPDSASRDALLTDIYAEFPYHQDDNDGDGFTNAEEVVFFGTDPSDAASAPTTAPSEFEPSSHDFCISAVCGDGIVGPGEACDDGNLQVGDGCSASCAEE